MPRSRCDKKKPGRYTTKPTVTASSSSPLWRVWRAESQQLQTWHCAKNELEGLWEQRYPHKCAISPWKNSRFLGTKLGFDFGSLYKGLARDSRPTRSFGEDHRYYKTILYVEIINNSLYICQKQPIRISHNANNNRDKGVANGHLVRQITQALSLARSAAAYAATGQNNEQRSWRRHRNQSTDIDIHDSKLICQISRFATIRSYAKLAIYAGKNLAPNFRAQKRSQALATHIRPSTQREVGRQVSTCPGLHYNMSTTAEPIASTAAAAAVASTSAAFPPGSKEQVAEKKRKARNDARNDRRKRRRIAGPLYPHAVNIYAGPAKELFTLTSWRQAKALAMKWIMANLIAAFAKGINTENHSIDDMKFVEVNNNNEVHEISTQYYHVHNCLKQKPRAPGVKTSLIPPEDRHGHGIILILHVEGVRLAQEAFTVSGVQVKNKEGALVSPQCSAKEEDTRAVYTVHLLINRNKNIAKDNMIYGQVAVDKWAGDLCTTTEEGSVWHYAVLVYKMPPLSDIEVTKIITPQNPNDSERLVLVLRMSAEWEAKLDSLAKTPNGEVSLRLGIGTFNLRKRRSGEKKAPVTKPPNPNPRERSQSRQGRRPGPNPNGADATARYQQDTPNINNLNIAAGAVGGAAANAPPAPTTAAATNGAAATSSAGMDM